MPKPLDLNRIVICGGGLSGSTCAIWLAKRGHAVTLLEKATFPRRKLCGEFLGPDAMPVLEKLGVLESVLARMPPIKTIRLHNRQGQPLLVKTEWIRKDYPYAVAASRAILDTLLLEHAKTCGVDVQENSRVVGYEKNGTPESKEKECFRLEVEALDNQATVQRWYETDWLIDASGRNSRLGALSDRMALQRLKDANKPGVGQPTSQIEKGVGIQCHIRIQSDNTDLAMFFFDEGYGGIQPISEERANLCLWVNPEAAQTCRNDGNQLLDLIGRNPAAKRMLYDAVIDENPQMVGGLRPLHRTAIRQNLLSIGDAALTVEPFSGFGMAHALQSGLLAAQVIDETLLSRGNYSQALAHYTRLHRHTFEPHMQVLKLARPLLRKAWLQTLCWPLLPPLLPLAAKLYR
jgi:menaquinone-9 beta-reductase